MLFLIFYMHNAQVTQSSIYVKRTKIHNNVAITKINSRVLDREFRNIHYPVIM